MDQMLHKVNLAEECTDGGVFVLAQLPCGYGKTVMMAAYAEFLYLLSKAEPSDDD